MHGNLQFMGVGPQQFMSSQQTFNYSQSTYKSCIVLTVVRDEVPELPANITLTLNETDRVLFQQRSMTIEMIDNDCKFLKY